MSDLRDLYQSLILDHGQNPRNKRTMECHEGGQCKCTEGYNPLCGDKLTLFVKAENGVLEDLSFDGHGCAIFTASSSMLTEVLKGRSIEEIRAIQNKYLEMLTNEDAEPDSEGLGKLAVFGGVKDFPARVKCATLPWRALEAILEAVDKEEESSEDPVVTE